jgi:hypothetical protein
MSTPSPFAKPGHPAYRNGRLRHVVLESPFAGDIQTNLKYARACLRDCLMRGESPIASHALLTQAGVLNDLDPIERAVGINAGHSWMHVCDAVVVYTDRGISKGMEAGIQSASFHKIPVEYRTLPGYLARPVDLAPEKVQEAIEVLERDSGGPVIVMDKPRHP